MIHMDADRNRYEAAADLRYACQVWGVDQDEALDRGLAVVDGDDNRWLSQAGYQAMLAYARAEGIWVPVSDPRAYGLEEVYS